MSILLQARDLSHAAGERALFAHLELAVNEGDRLALVGHNGSGKSTLLDLLCGTRPADHGDIQYRRDLRLGRVEQFLPTALSGAGLREAVAGNAPAAEAWRAERLLGQFGFSAQQLDQAVGSLSGGQQNRLMLARALMTEPDLLVLDEPTNHLDLATLLVFESVLEAFPGALLLVSHDRAFLDAVTRQTLFLRDGRLYRFDLPFSDARLALDDMDAANARARKAEEAQIERVRQSARRLAEWGRDYDSEKFARRARNMERRAERMEAERTFVTDGSPLNLDLSLGSTRSRQALAVEDLRVDVPGRVLFHVDELVIRPGERVALLGHNGMGKSTFIRILVSAMEGAGRQVRFSPQTVLGYYDQELDEVSGEESLMDFAVRRTRRDEQTIRNTLIHAGFAYSAHGRRVDTLSGGERARLLFLVLSLNAPNFLILDEPTNHIDIEGKEALEAQLLSGDATLLITSHDRRFLTTVASRYLHIDGGTLREINDPDGFLRGDRAVADGREQGGSPGSSGNAARPAGGRGDEDAILARIVELEELLAADRSRKPRHQKPERQAAWQQEIDALYRKLT